VSHSAKSVIVLAASTLVVAVLVWTITRDRTSAPYTVARDGLSGWSIVQSSADEPWVVALQPPATVSSGLFRQLTSKLGRSLVALPRPSLPLVLRSEYDDALQGVYGIDFIVRTARDAGMESASFQPVCVGHHIEAGGAERREIFFVAFESPQFRELRDELVPPQPEHGGVGVYDPAALTPVLPVAASVSEFARFWPIAFDPPTDCQAQVFVN
jgi:hypothetical protein